MILCIEAWAQSTNRRAGPPAWVLELAPIFMPRQRTNVAQNRKDVHGFNLGADVHFLAAHAAFLSRRFSLAGRLLNCPPTFPPPVIRCPSALLMLTAQRCVAAAHPHGPPASAPVHAHSRPGNSGKLPSQPCTSGRPASPLL